MYQGSELDYLICNKPREYMQLVLGGDLGEIYFNWGERFVMTAERIKSLRTARGWTQADLARRLGIARNGVNSWEQGLSMPSPAFLVELAKVFSVSTDYLLGIERLESLNVTGLAERDVAMLSELADRLRHCNND